MALSRFAMAGLVLAFLVSWLLVMAMEATRDWYERGTSDGTRD